MGFRKSLLCLSAIASLSPALALAGQPSYTYVEGGYVQLDLDESSLDPTGYFFDGSVAVAENWFLHAGYADVDDSAGPLKVEAEQLFLGGGFKTALNADTSVHVAVDYLDADATASHAYGYHYSDNSDGFGLSAGVRSMVAANIELNAELSYADLDSSNSTSIGVGAVWYVAENFGIGVGASFDDDSNSDYSIGARFNF